MKLYYSKGACSLAVRILIHELGLACEYEAVNLKTKITETGINFLTINPKGVVPVLVIDENQVITENAVIHQYLADQYDATELLPPVGNFKRYRILEWLNFISTDIHKSFGPLFISEVPNDLKETLFIPHLKSRFAVANQALEKHRFIAADHYTLPDGYLFVMLTWAMGMKIDLSEFRHLLRYFEELKQRKAMVEALAEEKK